MEQVYLEAETKALELLVDLLHVLAGALKSLPGKTPPTSEAAYLGWIAAFVNPGADGYLALRQSGRIAASKLLVRPVLEAVFSAKAVMEQRGCLFRKAYAEWSRDKQLFAKDAASKAAAAKSLDDLKGWARAQHPGDPIECKVLTVEDAAKAAGLGHFYDPWYRVYCQFTHGALRAIFGELAENTDRVDTPLVSWCVLIILLLLKKHTPAVVADLEPFSKRLDIIWPSR